MSCCGKKRQSLNFFPAINQAKQVESISDETILQQSRQSADAIFRYTGNTSLEVKSLFGGRRYMFSAAHPQQTIIGEDVAMMRAFAELTEVKANKVLAEN